MPRIGQVFPEEKVVLVGEQNPHGSDPQYALYPYPAGCAGHRLCFKVLGMSAGSYVKTFDRVNLCSGMWNAVEAAESAKNLIGRYVILLGKKVSTAFDVPFEPFAMQFPGTPEGGGGILVLPHPSGLNQMWNKTGMFERARKSVIEFAPRLKDVVGKYVNEEDDS